tara:strand:+ start:939 stop:1139 length:201 start_codon:yes stop_codon:yes gene_type:complete
MAEFCLECAREMWGEEIDSDFKGLLTEEEFKKDKLLSVLCEGCGNIYINHLGQKINEENFKSIKKN